ncbi:MAG: hypothetical protein JXQ91_03235 [Vannielia sp.]|uniref:hypothetical protein n=1 Tax=Vannielia sp. TaxID=2813045 RepID=UPI003B8CB710
MFRQPFVIAALIATTATVAQADEPPQEWLCTSATHSLAVSVMPSDDRPALFTLDETLQRDAKLTRRGDNLRLSATASTAKLFLALNLRDDGSTEIMVKPMVDGAETLFEPADCEDRAGLVAYLESRL